MVVGLNEMTDVHRLSTATNQTRSQLLATVLKIVLAVHNSILFLCTGSTHPEADMSACRRRVSTKGTNRVECAGLGIKSK